MLGLEQLDKLWSNLLALGTKRLAALGLVGLAVFASVGFGSYYLSRSDYDTLYAGLNPQDVSRIGSVLKDDDAGTWSWSYLAVDGPAGPITVTMTFTNASADLDLYLFSVSGPTFTIIKSSVGTTTTETFTTSVSELTPWAPISRAVASIIDSARGKSVFGSVNVKSASPAVLAFWMIMSTTMFAFAIGPSTFDARPGRSGIWRNVILAWSRSRETPDTTDIRFNLFCSLRRLMIPESSIKSRTLQWCHFHYPYYVEIPKQV